jgi:hypothetical protein
MATNYEHRPGQGSAWINKDKTEDWHAPFRGKVMLPDGSMHYLDIWNKKTQAGETWVSVKIGKQISVAQPVAQEMSQQVAQNLSHHNQAKGNGYQLQQETDSDIPF